MFGALPPAGSPIVFLQKPAPATSAPWVAAGERARYYASGTAALAATIASAIGEADGPRGVVLPAYGCPALVAATLWAGGAPMLVDLEPTSVRMDSDALEERLCTGRVAVVVATHLFGFSERVPALAALCRSHGVRLIEDSAQAVPLDDHAAAADATVYSFGRGKPVSVMGGGVVVVHRCELLDRLPQPETERKPAARRWRRRLDAVGYNIAIRPLPFRLLSSVPGSRIGETRYHPLMRLEPADAGRLAWLPANFARYREHDGRAGRRLSEVIDALIDVPLVDLSTRMGMMAESHRLLRYPLLMDRRTMRDRVLRRLRRAGLGGSSMYGAAMPNVPGMPEPVSSAGQFVQADNLADRLLTLPTHEGVTEQRACKIAQLLRESQ